MHLLMNKVRREAQPNTCRDCSIVVDRRNALNLTNFATQIRLCLTRSEFFLLILRYGLRPLKSY